MRRSDMNTNYNYANSEARSCDVKASDNEYNYYDSVTYQSSGNVEDNFKKTIERMMLTNALD